VNRPVRFFAALLACGAFTLCALGNRVSAATVDPASPVVKAAIIEAVEHDRKIYGGKTPVPGVLVAVWNGSGESYVHGFGYADLPERRPMTPADHFRIGSNTKTFVVTVLLQLVDEGKVRLDDPLSRFDVGVAVPNSRNITLREMCEMRSGLFEAYDVPEFAHPNFRSKTHWDPRTLVGWAVKEKPYFAPGTGYHYSNTNYLLLGLIIEKLTNDSVGDQITQRLIKPYHLTNTSYPATEAMPEPWARGYDLDAHNEWEDVSGTIPVSLMGAAGEMVSNIGDMKRWLKLYVTGETNSISTQRARLNCLPIGADNVSFGLGIACSSGWFGYTGGLSGYNTANYYFPAGGITVFAWVAQQRDEPSPGVANKIFSDIARIMTPSHPPFVLPAHRQNP
jgi:D-alanyl-D-alanine carboxypeptidase